MILTLTGPDNNTDIKQLIKLQEEYKFLEYGILISSSRRGKNRYPDYSWLSKLYGNNYNFRLSAHICGSYAKDMLRGNFSFIQQVPSNYNCFRRIQVNLIADDYLEPDVDNLLRCLNNEYELILPTKTFKIHKLALKKKLGGKKISILYDISGGRGLKPNSYSIPDISELPTGVAGGINLDNLEKVFNDTKDNKPGWIDLETGVRTEKDEFDIEKAEKICQKFKILSKQ